MNLYQQLVQFAQQPFLSKLEKINLLDNDQSEMSNELIKNSLLQQFADISSSMPCETYVYCEQ